MPTGVYKRKPFTEKHKTSISESMKGKNHTKEWKRKRKEISKKLWQNPSFRKKVKEGLMGHLVSKKTREKIRKARIGMKFSDEHKQNLRKSHIGYKQSEKHKKKIGKANKGIKRPAGKKHYNWMGGSSKEPYAFEFNKKLKEQIKKRDNYICQLCRKTQKEQLQEIRQKLTIHHIDYNKNNCKENNLITLCHGCNSKVNFDRLDWIKFFKNIIDKNN